MNKIAKVVLNVLIVIAAVVSVVLFIVMAASVRYANRKTEDPVESEMRVFEYELSHRAYGEIMGSYYAERLSRFDPMPGMEDIYNVAQYAHAAFMSRVYAEKKDESMICANEEKIESLRNRLGAYAYTADEIDAMINAVRFGK